MVKVEAYVDGDGVTTNTHIEGVGEDIFIETLTLISTLMNGIKQESIELHAMILMSIANDTSILRGDTSSEDRREMN